MTASESDIDVVLLAAFDDPTDRARARAIVLPRAGAMTIEQLRSEVIELAREWRPQ